MKIRVTPKDLTLFIIFCAFLLILSSLAVLNVSSLLNDAEFFGLNFFRGFFPPYLLPTLVLFFIVLIAIFLSVSSYIFERDKGSKGLGLSLKEKDEKGYSRWLKESEMKKAPGIVKVPVNAQTASGAGIVVINDGKNMYVDNEHHHTMVVGQTGSGKTTALVDPLIYSLSKKGESMIMTDPKGEIYKNHSEMLRAKGYKIFVLNFREPNLGNAWNPLSLPYQLYKQGNTDKAIELIEDIAINIMYDPKNNNDPFWEKSAADYFSGLVLGLFEDAKEEQINISSINYMSTVGEENFATSNYVKEYFTMKGQESSPYIFASNTITAPSETKGSILSVFRQKIRQFSTKENLSEMLSYSDFNMRDIGNEKTAVFMVVQDEKTTYHALATIFIKQCYETLIDVAQHEPGGRLKYRTNFILDEFANMPPLKDVTTMVTAARSRSIRFTFIVQNFAQLNDVYGKEDAETIRSNCGNLIYLLTTELAALEEISKLCGEVKSKEKEKTASTPLITVSDLQKLKMNEVIILHSRLYPFKTKLKPSYEIDWGTSGFGEGQFVQREKREIEFFDIKEFVKLKKRNKLFESLENAKEENETEKKDELSDTQSFPSTFVNDINSFNPFNVSKDNNIDTFDDTDSNDKEEVIDDFELQKEVNNAPKFNIDSIVKRIDEKIAELEEQERLEKLNTDDTSNDSAPDYDKLDSTVVERFDDFMNNSNDEVSKDEPVVNIDNDSNVLDDDNDDVTDDQYYDDFFS